jgi:hypothetical protein
VVGKEPDVERDQPRDHREDDGREEKRLEHGRDRVHDALGHERGLEFESEHRVELLELRLLRAVRGCDHTQRSQPLIHELPHVVPAHSTFDRLADGSGDLLIGPLPVCGLGDEVEERRKLHDLTVRASRDVGRLFEARPLVFPDQLDALGEFRFLGRRAVGRRSLVGYGKDFGLLLFRS